jgi:hypothetical protein
MMKIKNRILAIPAAAAAIPKKPNIAAMIATIRNTTAHPNMAPPEGASFFLPLRTPFLEAGCKTHNRCDSVSKAGLCCRLENVPALHAVLLAFRATAIGRDVQALVA